MLFGHTRHLAATTPIDSEWRLRIAKRQMLSRTMVNADAKKKGRAKQQRDMAAHHRCITVCLFFLP